MHKTATSKPTQHQGWRKITSSRIEAIGKILQLLADETRLALFHEIDAHDGTKTVSELQCLVKEHNHIDRTMAAISASLGSAELQGVLQKREKGRECYYAFSPPFQRAMDRIGGIGRLGAQTFEDVTALVESLSVFIGERDRSRQRQRA